MRPTIILLALFGAAFAPAQQYQDVDLCDYWPLAVGNRWEYVETDDAPLEVVGARDIGGHTVYKVDDRLVCFGIGCSPSKQQFLIAVVDSALYLQDSTEELLAAIATREPTIPARVYDGMPVPRISELELRLGVLADFAREDRPMGGGGVDLQTPAIAMGVIGSDTMFIVLASGIGPVFWDTYYPMAATLQDATCVSSVTPTRHDADLDGDGVIILDELMRVIQLYNSLGYDCANLNEDSEDGYIPGRLEDEHPCLPHTGDYVPIDWSISLDELLRVIQFYNSGGVYACDDELSEDGYCAGLPG